MKYEKTFKENIKVKVSVLTLKEYYKKYPQLIVINILIMIVASLIGLVITNISGAIVGFTIGILSFCYLPPAIIKIREIQSH